MNDTPAPAAPLAPVESFTTPELAQAEYKRYAGSPEYQQAAANPHGRGPALSRLEALAQRAWPTAGLQASPAPGSPQEARRAAEAHVDLLHQQGGETLGGEPLSEADAQAMADAFAPRSANDFLGAVPNGSGEFAAEFRQQLFDDQISPSVANLITQAPHMAEQASALDDDSYYAAHDKAAADVEALPGGRMMLKKAIAMVAALPAGHAYIPIAEALMLRPGGILEIAHWSDRLRKARGVK